MFPGTRSEKTLRNQAAEWSWKLISSELSESERAAFNAWVAEPGSGSELNAHHTVVNLAQDLPERLKNDIVTHTFPERPALTRARRLFLHPAWMSACAATLAVAAVVGAWRATHSVKPVIELRGQNYATEPGEVRNITLPDGSNVDLNTRSRMRWIGTPADRRVELVDGEALFEVVHNPDRPFRIFVDNSEIRVLGTRFDVYRKANGNVVVTVLSGTVAIDGFKGDAVASTKPSWNVQLTTNQQVEYSPTGLVGAVHSTEAPKSVEWLQGVFQAEQEPLPVFVQELRRYSKKSVVSDESHSNCAVGGIFTILDVPAVLGKLERSGNIIVTSTDNAYILSCRSEFAPDPASQPARSAPRAPEYPGASERR